MNFTEVIARRRDGGPNSPADLALIAEGAARGSVPDYQLSAWLMAAFLRPMTVPEIAQLAVAMANSGDRVDLTGLPRPWIDKHSTGGVGDKVTLVALPLMAACGITAVKMSGAGLGHMGGTVDKLASIPGFRLDLSPDEMRAQARRIGIAITGQSPNLAPADKALYALRDVTGTVGSMGLIASSILSKKIAGGAEIVVIDVKCGNGALLPTTAEGRELAALLVEIGQEAGLTVRAVLTDMDQPLGVAIGNAMEVREAVEVLQNRATGAQTRVREVAITLVGVALAAAGQSPDVDAGIALATEAMESGRAWTKFQEWVMAQGGDLDRLPQTADTTMDVTADSDGWITGIDARALGEAVVDLGGGRRRKGDAIDPRVGIETRAMIGSPVAAGDPLARIHASAGHPADADRVRGAFTIGNTPVAPRPAIIQVR